MIRFLDSMWRRYGLRILWGVFALSSAGFAWGAARLAYLFSKRDA